MSDYLIYILISMSFISVICLMVCIGEERKNKINIINNKKKEIENIFERIEKVLEEK